MNFYIKEWANKTATLMTDMGQVLWTFPNAEEAYKVCEEYYSIQLCKDSAANAPQHNMLARPVAC